MTELSKIQILEKWGITVYAESFAASSNAMKEYADQHAKKEAIAFAKFYHNHVIETSQPPFNTRTSIEQLYESEEFKKYLERQNKERNEKI